MVEFFSRRDKLLRKRWYFRIRAENHEILVTSEAYNSQRARWTGFQALHDELATYVNNPIPIHDRDHKTTRKN